MNEQHLQNYHALTNVHGQVLFAGSFSCKEDNVFELLEQEACFAGVVFQGIS
jgi:hypothetical protein